MSTAPEASRKSNSSKDLKLFGRGIRLQALKDESIMTQHRSTSMVTLALQFLKLPRSVNVAAGGTWRQPVRPAQTNINMSLTFGISLFFPVHHTIQTIYKAHLLSTISNTFNAQSTICQNIFRRKWFQHASSFYIVQRTWFKRTCSF